MIWFYIIPVIILFMFDRTQKDKEKLSLFAIFCPFVNLYLAAATTLLFLYLAFAREEVLKDFFGPDSH